MGLDISCGKESWRIGSYTYFHDFRKTLAKKLWGLDYDRITDKDFLFMPDGLRIFFGHSDCDGKLTPKQSAKVFKDFLFIVHLRQVPLGWENDFEQWLEAFSYSIKFKKPIIFS